MKISVLNYLAQRIRETHPRTRKLQLNAFIGLCVKGVGMLISLLLVPLTIDYLSKETYGAWLTISSVVTMLSFFDIGIGNGLRNKISEAISKEDNTKARAYISTAYALFGIIQLIIILLFYSIYSFIPWQKVFNTSINEVQLNTIIIILVISMAIKLVLDMLTYILMALQQSGLSSILNLITNALILIGTFIISKIAIGNLLYLAVLTAVSPILVLLISSIIFFSTYLKDYRPTISSIDWKFAKGLLSLGYQFFIIQLAVIVIFYSDNLIISQLFGPSEVSTYNVAFRYFNSINIIFTIIISPYWSAFTEAFIKNDRDWIKRTYRSLQKMWVGLAVSVCIMILFSDIIYEMWIGDRVKISITLSICTGLFVIVSSWNSINSLILNGTGKIKLQLLVAVFCATINVPFAIILGKHLKMMSSGIILATTCTLLIGSVLGSMQVKRIVSDKAKGIWNK
ncbi:oligosaccharide flippase family protein [Spirosoma sp. 48-14]|uniref:oligosaccharide flippase family protein n=1 Tax=Spirosoma sp. 48-14 TaxID=1895854 RepID=UPI000960C4AE|nr:oligosaccharide flippase family protein [Spirosoma sp. 48-14]OJW78853.1 MAG: hypothetical protein BGO59_10280 [Spirosoma sp. 48-14]